MKNTFLTLALCLVTSIACHAEEIPELRLRDLDASVIENWQSAQVKPCIVWIEAGDEIPLTFNLSGTVLTFTQVPEGGKIQALQGFYIKIVDKETLLVSKDKVNWKPFGDFFGGQLSALVEPSTYQELTGKIALEIHTK